MSLYIALKFIHILPVCMMLGATLCNGLLHMQAIRSGKLSAAKSTLENIIQINRYIMAPSFVLIIVSGALLAYEINYKLTENWLAVSILLVSILVIEFLVGSNIEEQMKMSIETALENAEISLPKQYWSLFNKASSIGGSATIISLIVLFLMISKP